MATFDPEALRVLGDPEVRFVSSGRLRSVPTGRAPRLRVAAAVFGAGG